MEKFPQKSYSKETSKEDQIIFRNNGGEPNSLDPHQSATHRDFMIKNDLFQGLVSFNEKGEVIPGVAKSWSVSKDGLVYTFKLRQNARWSNGELVKASDFVYAFQRLINPEGGYPPAFLLENLKNAPLIMQGKIKNLNELGVKAVDDWTLVIHLEFPSPYLLDILAGYAGYPLYEKAVQKHGKEWAKPGKMVCNGPFILEEWAPNEYIRIGKNPYFWEKEAVKPHEVYYLSIADEAVEFNMFRSGMLDITWLNLQGPPTLELMRRTSPFVVYIDSTLQMGLFVFSSKNSSLKNKTLREALNLCIDRELLSEKILPFGINSPLDTFCLPGLKNKLKITSPCKGTLQARQERARHLYKEAGYNERNPLKIDLLLPNMPDRRKIGVGIAGMIKQVLGAEINLEVREFKVYIEQRRKNVYDIYDMRWIFDYNDVTNLIGQFETKSGKEGSFFYSNAEFDSLLQKSRLEADTAKRDLLLSKACQILLNDHIVCPLFSMHNAFFVHPRLGGVVPNCWGVHPSRYLFIDKTRTPLSF